MKTKIIRISLTIIIAGLLISTSSAQNKKLAQSGMKFLNVSTNAHNAGMADAITSLHGGSSAMLYNPAAMSEIPTMVDFEFNQTQWIADINYLSATAAFQPFGPVGGVFGISLVSVDYGDFKETVRSTNDKGFLDVGTYSPTAVSIGLGYARSLSQKFSIGGNLKYVRQSLIGNGKTGIISGGYSEEKFETDVFAFDFGLIYRTGFESLNLGMSIRNFSEELKYIEEGFQLPLIFQIGMSMDLVDIIELDKTKHSLLLSVDASHPRDYPEQIYIGSEYTFINSFSLRAGYNFPRDDGGFAAGIGIKQNLAGVGIGIDYAYAPYSIFSDVHRFSIKFAY
ncbi:MAG: DUF3308 domain-containing protein [Ignavibacteriae bacterium HGW-Ignavibacteriae-2]|jgi:hypothetical protein|nr:PorV/PorQ family protein [Bacteroidota bacterium]PKL90419.1 MAG: DUF3308 domain-containing protein [Ignavibacteriae bacterium HGW-Ignavibacteriae-2]